MICKSRSNLNKVVVLSVDVRDIRLVVVKSSVVPSVVPDPDPESWKRFHKIILRTISTHLWNKLTNHPRIHFDLIVVIICRCCGRAVFHGGSYLDNSDQDKDEDNSDGDKEDEENDGVRHLALLHSGLLTTLPSHS